MANNKIARAINRAQRTQDRIAALEAALLEEEREADRVLGEAIRQAVDNPRSKWASHVDLTVKEFYFTVVFDGDDDDEPSENSTGVVGGLDGEKQHPAPKAHASERGAGVTDAVGEGQGF